MKTITSKRYIFIITLLFISFTSCKNEKIKSKKESQIERQETIVEPKIDSVAIAIINGNVLDGTGKQSYKANIYINADSIFYIGNLTNPELKIGKSSNTTPLLDFIKNSFVKTQNSPFCLLSKDSYL